jgi:hypothetical protein
MHIIQFILLQKRVFVVIARSLAERGRGVADVVAAGAGSDNATRSKFAVVTFFFVKVLRGVGGEGGFGVGGEGGVCAVVGHHACAAVFHHGPDGEVGGADEEEAVFSGMLEHGHTNDGNTKVRTEGPTYKTMTPKITVPVLSLHLPGLPKAKASHPSLPSLAFRSSSFAGSALLPAPTYVATATQAVNQSSAKTESTAAKA